MAAGGTGGAGGPCWHAPGGREVSPDPSGRPRGRRFGRPSRMWRAAWD